MIYIICSQDCTPWKSIDPSPERIQDWEESYMSQETNPPFTELIRFALVGETIKIEHFDNNQWKEVS